MPDLPVSPLRGGHGGDQVLARVARSLGVVENPLNLKLYLGRREEPVLPVARHAVELAPVQDGPTGFYPEIAVLCILVLVK